MDIKAINKSRHGFFGKNYTYYLAKIVTVSFFSLFIFNVLSSSVSAATRTWDGGGGADTNWSTDANWSSDTEPVSGDTVVFDNTSDNNSVVDAGFTGVVTSVSINSGYDGTITLARSLQTSGSYSQAAGSFTAANQTLTVNTTFALSGGTFTASSGTTSVGTALTISGSPTFNHNNGTFTFIGTSGATLSCNNVTFNLVAFTHTSGTKTVSSNCSFPLGANPTVSADIALTGTLSGSGTLTFTAGTFSLNSGATLSGFTGLVTNILTVSGATLNLGSYSVVDINNAFNLSSGSFTAPSGSMTVARGLTISGGSFVHNSGTLTFDNNTSDTLSCNNVSFNRVTFAHTGGTKTVSSNCNLPLGSNPTIGSGAGGTITLNGTISGTGTLTTNAGTLTLNTGAVLSGFSGLVSGAGLTVAGATIDLGSFSPVDVNGAFTLSSGSVTMPTGTATFASTFTISGSPTFNHNNGTITFDGGGATLSCNNVSFNLVNVWPTSSTKTINSDCLLPLGNNPTMNTVAGSTAVVLNGTLSGTGTLTARALTLNTRAVLSGFSGLVAEGNFTNAGATTDLSSYTTVDFNGTTSFSLSSGTFTAPSGTMTVAAGFTISGGIFNHNNGTVTFDGGSGTLSCNTTSFNLIIFAHTSGTKTVSSNCSFPLGNNPIVGNGGSITLTGTLSGSGTYTQSLGQLRLNAASVFSGFSGLSILTLVLEGGDLNLGGYSLVDINNHLTINSGTFIAPETMTVAGNFTISGGTFTHNNGTVTLDGTNQNLSGSTTFHNLTKNASSVDTLTFTAGTTQTISGSLNLQGVSGELLSLLSSSPGSSWNIDATGGRVLKYLDVQDSNNTNTLVMSASSSIDSENNTNWEFSGISINFSLDTPVHESYTNNERPTFKWKTATNVSGGISKYILEIDNGDTGDFKIDNFPISRTTDYETSRYVVHYENFSDSDDTNNTIAIYTKSSKDWDEGNNDGKIKEGKRTWRVTAKDNAGNEETNTRTLFVDRTAPSVTYGIATSPQAPRNDEIFTSDTTPTLSGKLTDTLAGDKTENYIASGPKEVSLKFEHLVRNIFFQEEYIIDEIITAPVSSDGIFFVSPLNSLSSRSYRVTIIGFDKAGNSSFVTQTMNISSSSYSASSASSTSSSVTQPVPTPKYPSQKDEVVTPSPTMAKEASAGNMTAQTENQTDSKTKGQHDLTGNVNSLTRRIWTFVKGSFIGLLSSFKHPSYFAQIPTLFRETIFDSKYTSITNVQIKSISKDEAILTWKTSNHTYNNKVNFGENRSYGKEQFADEFGKEHRVKLTGLKPNTHYYFEVMSQSWKTYVYDATFEFTTK